MLNIMLRLRCSADVPQRGTGQTGQKSPIGKESLGPPGGFTSPNARCHAAFFPILLVIGSSYRKKHHRRKEQNEHRTHTHATQHTPTRYLNTTQHDNPTQAYHDNTTPKTTFSRCKTQTVLGHFARIILTAVVGLLKNCNLFNGKI